MPEDDNTRTITKDEFVAHFDRVFPLTAGEVRRDEIGGLEHILDQIENFKRGIEHPKLYQWMGATPPNGFILHGPPGYGKTLLAKYIAHELDARFVDLPLNKFESKWVGEAEKTLAQMLDLCLAHYKITGKKVLMFMDEAEEALKDRRREGWHGPRVNVLLRYMDGLGDNNGVIYGAATNYIDKVDPAFLRSGRLDYKIEIQEYGPDGLADVVRATATRMNRKAKPNKPCVFSQEDRDYLGKEFHDGKYSPADIAESFRLAAEEKIAGMIEHQGIAFSEEMYQIRKQDILKQIPKLRVERKVRLIGFRRD